MPLYTIWKTGSWGNIAFAAVHCTGGDILIALASLTIALIVVGSSAWPFDRFGAVAVLAVILGIAYTTFSEYLNIVVRATWAYSDLMPLIQVFDFQLGLSPLLQWFFVPAAGFLWARRSLASSPPSSQ